MKAEFELSLDTNGKSMIKFMHSDKSESLEQKILKVFIEAAKEKGITLKKISGFATTGGSSFDSYEIQIDDNKSAIDY
ncbi:MAG TPA: hypothetical protein VJ881_09125, partial [Halanaerobiales bacterium]|nr:hypothetical protein [Halanaerobiales bacterium]